MNQRFAAALCLLGSGVATPRAASAASFHCAKARTSVEKMICSDSALSDLDGRLASAYRRALVVAADPESQKAEQRAWLMTERKKCADVACLKQSYQQRLTALEAAVGHKSAADYAFTKTPFISPMIVDDLSGSVSDEGDQIIAINLTDSVDSNRYSCEVKVQKSANESPYVSCETPGEEGERPESFGYQFVGRTSSGIDVLQTRESGGGTGVFENLLLVRVEVDAGGSALEPAGGRNQTLAFKKKRLVIKKLGEIGLGDRWSGRLKVAGDEISIGNDTGFFSAKDKTRGYVIKIGPPP
jgi:uncharacterized protein